MIDEKGLVSAPICSAACHNSPEVRSLAHIFKMWAMMRCLSSGGAGIPSVPDIPKGRTEQGAVLSDGTLSALARFYEIMVQEYASLMS